MKNLPLGEFIMPRMALKTIAAKVRPGELYADADLIKHGLIFGNAIKCSQCDCRYRVFYGPSEKPASVYEAAIIDSSFTAAVEKSHPEHPEELLRPATRN